MSDRITLTGRIGKDPERRSTKSGEVWLSFRVASTPRVRNEQGAWSDGETSWYSVNAYGALARNAAESLHQGERVVVTGDLTVRSWTTADGRSGTSAQIRALAIGHDLTFGTTSLSRSPRRQEEPDGREPGQRPPATSRCAAGPPPTAAAARARRSAPLPSGTT